MQVRFSNVDAKFRDKCIKKYMGLFYMEEAQLEDEANAEWPMEELESFNT